MTENLLHVTFGSKTFVWVVLEKLLDEVSALVWQVVFGGWNPDPISLDVWLNLFTAYIPLVVWCLSKEHLIGQNTERPPVYRKWVAWFGKNFRSHELQSATYSFGCMSWLYHFWNSKIREGESTICFYQHVFRFQISMGDVLGVQEAKREYNLHHIVLCVNFAQNSFLL